MALSKDEFKANIAVMARHLSRERKAEGLLDPAWLDGIYSSPEDMQSDWDHAIGFWVEKLLTRSLFLRDLQPTCYHFIEGLWLDEVKQRAAYLNWLSQREEETFWTTPANCQKHYCMACEEIRDDLLNKAHKEPVDDFSEVQGYIERNYWSSDGVSENDQQLIDRKAARLRDELGENRACACAKAYVRGYYSAIIPAITERDADKKRAAMLQVLNAFKGSGSPQGAPGIVNTFEALLAVLFFDAEIVESIWKDPNEISRNETF